ncbi:hypothetical protein LCGC14_3159600, partial [marine sediment metagenome]
VLEKNPSALTKDLALLITTRNTKIDAAIAMAKLLLEAGANPNAENKQGVKRNSNGIPSASLGIGLGIPPLKS